MANSEQSDRRRTAFLRLAEARTNAVIDRIRVLSNCSNPYAYEYYEEDIRRIFQAIDAELRTARARFDKKQKKPPFRLSS